MLTLSKPRLFRSFQTQLWLSLKGLVRNIEAQNNDTEVWQLSEVVCVPRHLCFQLTTSLLTQIHSPLVFKSIKNCLVTRGKGGHYYVVDDFDVGVVFASKKPNTTVCKKRTFGEQKNIRNSSFFWRESVAVYLRSTYNSNRKTAKHSHFTSTSSLQKFVHLYRLLHTRHTLSNQSHSLSLSFALCFANFRSSLIFLRFFFGLCKNGGHFLLPGPQGDTHI